MDIRSLEKWNKFVAEFKLSEEMQDKFEKYFKLLIEWNDIHNLTAIEGTERILMDHFWDSLEISKFMDFNKLESICDVGAGAGFPGIPLKILFPNLKLYLIEVSKKKVAFLEEVKDLLQLSDTEVIDLDWRTFLRKTNYKIDIFVSRAALETEELLRCLKPGCFYKDSQLVYWASTNWHVAPREEPFLQKLIPYKVGHKKRIYAIFAVINN